MDILLSIEEQLLIIHMPVFSKTWKTKSIHECVCFCKSTTNKALISLLCFTRRKSKHPSHESAFQSTRKQYFHCFYVLEAGIKAIHECVFAVYKKAVLLLFVSFTGRYQKHPGQCVLQSTRKHYVLRDWL